MLEFHDFATGSSGNCYLVTNEETKILIECGVKKKNLMRYLMSVGLNISQLDGCLTSHIHTDHTLSIEYVSDYIDTYSTREVHNKYSNVIALESKKPIMIGTIKVLPILVEHGSCENYAYVLMDKNSTMFFGTDFSLMSQNVSNFKFDTILIECNYDDELITDTLNNSNEQHIKYIRQVSTHMSKENCKVHLRNMDLSKCKKIVLLHPSAFLLGKTKTIEEIEQEFKIKTIFAKEK